MVIVKELFNDKHWKKETFVCILRFHTVNMVTYVVYNDYVTRIRVPWFNPKPYFPRKSYTRAYRSSMPENV